MVSRSVSVLGIGVEPTTFLVYTVLSMAEEEMIFVSPLRPVFMVFLVLQFVTPSPSALLAISTVLMTVPQPLNVRSLLFLAWHRGFHSLI